VSKIIKIRQLFLNLKPVDVIFLKHGVHVGKDMISNWWNDVAIHSWEWTFSLSELLTYGTDFQVM